MNTDTRLEERCLTEAELLAMPESDYMNADQLTFFRQLLTRQRDELLENGQSTIHHLQETEATPDEADAADGEQQR